MKVAVEGCAHGELDKIYECIDSVQRKEGIQVDLLICCGDFQSVRNHEDLKAMAVPTKYQQMCSFYKYYSGEKRAPILTIFIGGNHEASNYLQELPYGGWVAPNIYYMGRAGVVQFGNLRIGGMSGIFKNRDYLQGHHECLPYTRDSVRSVYHVRNLEAFRLSQIKERIHIMMSHDWPKGITKYGDEENLLRWKPYFREDIDSNRLGNAPAMTLLQSLKPNYWFAAHLHCKFTAQINHEDNKHTNFLALDKCLPKRKHLQVVCLPSEYDGDMCLKYDAEWLAILKNTNHLLTVRNVNRHMPGPGGNERYDFTPTKEEKDRIINLLGDLVIKEESFVRTAPIHSPNIRKNAPLIPIMNPQTTELCEKIGIDDPVHVVMARTGRTMKVPNVESQQRENSRAIAAEESPSPAVQTPEPAQVMQTPRRSLVLPAPVTPSTSERSLELEPSTSSATVSDSFDSIVYEDRTPMSETPKKNI